MAKNHPNTFENGLTNTLEPVLYCCALIYFKKGQKEKNRDRKISILVKYRRTSINWSWWHLFPFFCPSLLHSLHLSSLILKRSLLLFIPQGQLPCDLPEVCHHCEKLYCSTVCPSCFVSVYFKISFKKRQRKVRLALAGYHNVHHPSPLAQGPTKGVVSFNAFEIIKRNQSNHFQSCLYNQKPIDQCR